MAGKDKAEHRRAISELCSQPESSRRAISELCSQPESSRPPDRRLFLRSAAAGFALSSSTAAASYAKTSNSNERIRVALVGCGGRAQAHAHILKQLKSENVEIAAVCDVWDGHSGEYISHFGNQSTKRSYRQGLKPTASFVGLDPENRKVVTKDYRRILDNQEIDAVCIATPDHWHARMTIDALAASKHVFVERPIAHTPIQAQAVLEAAAKTNCIVSVGVQSLADPSIGLAKELVRSGKIGPVVHLAGGAFRNDSRGQWRFYRVLPEMNQRSIAWDLFLGHRFEVAGEQVGPDPRECPFDAQAFAQWRCEERFSAGPVSEMLNPVITRLLAISEHRQVCKTMKLGSLTHETDGRSVPDCVTLAAEFAEGSHLTATATTLSNYPIEEVVRGRQGTLKLVKAGVQYFKDNPNQGTTFPVRIEEPLKQTEQASKSPPKNETEELWRDFIRCIRSNSKATICPPDLAAAAVFATC